MAEEAEAEEEAEEAEAEEPSSFRARVLRELRLRLAPIYQDAEASRLATEIEASALRMGVTNKGDYLRNIAVRLTAVVKNSQGVQQHSRQMRPVNAGQGGTTGEADCKDEMFDKFQVEVAASQKAHHMHGGAETPAAKKPIDRLIAALRSASPAVLRSSAQSICSVVCMADRIPHSELQPYQDYMCSKRQRRFNKMKRAFDVTSWSICPPLGSTEGSCMTLECDASDYSFCRERSIKRQKTQVEL